MRARSLFLSALGLLSACSPQPEKSHDASVMVIRLIANPGSLDPQQGDNAASTMAAMFAYDRVLANVDGTLRPQIAERWQATPDHVTLWIRPDVTCSDGHHITASDIAANFRRMVDPVNGSAIAAGVFGSTAIAVSADDAARRVDVQMPMPNGEILYGLARVPIVCPAGLADLDKLRSQPDGTGPYRLVSAVPGERYVYALRKEYRWGPGGMEKPLAGAPRTVILKVVENESTAANMLRTGALDIARISGPDRSRLDRGATYDKAVVKPSLFSLFFNQHEDRPGRDPLFRRALVQALDRRSVALAAAGPGAHVADSFLAPGAPCYDPANRAALPLFDPVAAGKVLDRAGYRMVDGRRRDRHGRPITIQVILPSEFDLASDLLVHAWDAIGIRATVRSENEAQMTMTTFSGGDWDVVMVNGDATISGRNAAFFMGPPPPDGLDFTFAQDQNYARLVEAARRQAMPGGCPAWQKANSYLLTHNLLAPVFFGDFVWFGRNVRFKPFFNDQSVLYPTSLARD